MAKYVPPKMIGTRISADEYAAFEAEAERRGTTTSALLRTTLQSITAKLIERHGHPNPKPKGVWGPKPKAPPKEKVPKEPTAPVYYQFPLSLIEGLKKTAHRTSQNPRVLMAQAVQSHLETLNQLED